MKKIKINEDAVSPVIGVMLMIVVTVVIAAVVSGFAGGMSDNQEAATTAAIQCNIVKDDENAVLTFKHMSGDSIYTQDMMIYVSYSTDGVPQQKRTKGVENVAGFTNSQGDPVSATVPYLTDVKVGDVGDDETNYGNFIWNPGQIITTGNAAGFTAITNLDPTNVEIGDILNIRLVDTNSQKTIFEKDVRVQ